MDEPSEFPPIGSPEHIATVGRALAARLRAGELDLVTIEASAAALDALSSLLERTQELLVESGRLLRELDK